ncbi:MAG: NADP-binding protein [Candidatus Bathyarchaeia archaeon]|jgi:4-hydroxy-tetrahydrodipicolinate reductase
MEKIKVISFGMGVVGGFIAKFLLEKEGVEIVGAVDVAKDKIGKDIGEVLGLNRKVGTKISKNIESALRDGTMADIAIHTTSSFLKDTYPQIASILKQGVNVVSTCEELSYPYVSEPELARKLDALAKKHDATVLGTGINPGFLMDTLVITLTSACEKIDKIEVTRIMNAATRRVPFQKKIGAGLTTEEFQKKITKKHITGHVGLEQSISMIANALAWKLDKINVQSVERVIAKKAVESKDIRVDAGKVAGLKQKAQGIVKNREAINLDFQAYIGAREEYDSVTIKGVPNINQKIQPCVHGDIGTVAVVVNAIPRVINAPAGLYTMKDLPVPSATPEDMRKYMKTAGQEATE